jgi:hypothetical protein
VDHDTFNDTNSLMVKVWDTGPLAPNAPSKPALPTGKEGSPDYDLAMIEFKGELAAYEKALVGYGAQKRDHADWHAKYGGPYEIEMYSIDAREALMIAPDRYFVSDSRIKNHGLPEKRKPGKWHEDQKQLRAEASRMSARDMKRDPVFGSQGAAL